MYSQDKKVTVYVETEGKKIRLRNKNIVIYDDNKENEIPIEIVDKLIIRGNTSLTTNIITELIGNGIKIILLGYYGNYICSINTDIVGNVQVRHNQLRIADNDEKSLQIGKEIIHGKVLNQRNVLDRYRRNYKCKEIEGTIAKLDEILDLVDLSITKIQLMGYEGKAAEIYFSCFNNLIFSSEFRFEARSYNPPLDDVNAMLSFGYGLLRSEIEKDISICGLDPYVGFLHSERSGKPSLALDLMEEFRPFMIDRLIISIINRNQVNKADFITEDKAVYCNDNTRKLIIKYWEERKRKGIEVNGDKTTYAKIMLEQTRLLVRSIKGEDEYKSYIWR